MAFGKKNSVKLDPLAYNICLLGESKVGKTTLIKEVCEKLAGDDGYLFLECGSERGADAIQGINYINCPEWNMDYDELTNSAGLADVCEDIIDNKTSEYPNLRAVIFDTYDHLIDIAEAESIRLWNKECRDSGHPEKCVKSINQAWSGYGRGEKKAIEIMFDTMAQLRNVGVASIIIGHVKTKEVSDVVSGESYQILTSDQQQNYFNALKKNLHFLGLAYIDRDVVKEKTGRKNAVTKKEETINKISSESRKIKFRDDNYAVDSGSRFADIIPEIDMNADAFIQALTDAIKAEQAKSGVSLADAKKQQAKQNKELEKRVAKHEEEAKSKAELDEVIEQIVEFFTENKSDIAKIKPILAACKESGFNTPKDIDNIDDAKKILALTLA
nr:MAG TPA: AAA domain protein [Caudoviricetes sp.]